MSAFHSLSSHLRDLGHSQGSAGHLRSIPAALEGSSWSGQMAQSATAQSLLGEALLDNLALPGEISALAVDPVQGYLAVGESVESVSAMITHQVP